ncbi:MAG: peptidase [Candidatus Zixiibacteriota bacterium]|nr:MAG: peptidase [candidate division Zixibacteria bacterium]
MHKRFVTVLPAFVLIAFLFNSCGKDKVTEPEPPPDLLVRLNSLPGVTATEIDSPSGTFHTRAFEMDIAQPIDHDNPDMGTFNQRVYLLHFGERAPMVLETSGYAMPYNRVGEVTDLLRANQLHVSHRYMGNPRPDQLDWEYLTVAQAAADHHHIVELFKQIYTGQWVSTGRSKGGQASLFHRRYYPDDVAVTLAMVAPIVYGTEDPRFDVFLNEVVSDSICREKIRQYQIRCLQERDSLLPYLEHYADTSWLTFSITMDSALEYSVLEFPFAFFQAGSGDCADIPDSNSSYREMFDALMTFSSIALFSDEYSDYYCPVYYQIYTELGYYRLITDHLLDLLEVMPDPTYARFGPPGVEMVYRPEVVQDLAQWLRTEGDSIIYVYGAVDPWSAAAVELGGDVEALFVLEPGANHSVQIQTLSNPGPVYEKLELWLGIEVQRLARPPNQHTLPPVRELSRIAPLFNTAK